MIGMILSRLARCKFDSAGLSGWLLLTVGDDLVAATFGWEREISI